MKLKLSIIISIFISGMCFTQPRNIELPKGNGSIDINKEMKHLSFYVTKDYDIYFENQKLKYWNDISNAILDYERSPGKPETIRHIILYIDKNVDYFIVDRLRVEIGSVWQGYLHFKSGTMDDFSSTTLVLFGSEKSKNFENMGVIGINQKRAKGIEIERNNWWPLPYPIEHTNVHAIYLAKKGYTDSRLKTIDYKTIVVSSKYIEVNSSLYMLDDKKYQTILKDVLKKNEMILLEFNGLYYGEYYNFLENLNEFRGKFTIDTLRKPLIVDISYELSELLSRKGININQ